MSAPAKLDWTDPAAVMSWLGALRVAVDDANGVALDMLHTPRRRDLGHREHVRLHREARTKLASLLDFATPSAPPDDGSDGEPHGDPSGAGASPVR